MSPQEGRREAVLDAATAWVLDHGLTGLSLRPLARDLGTSDRMLLYYFGSKVSLVGAVLERANHQLAALVAGDAGEPGGAGALLDMWWRVSAPDTAPYLRLYFEVFGLALQQPETYRPYLIGVHRAWLDLAAARLCPEDAAAPATILRATTGVALTEGLLLDLLVTGDRERVDAAATAALGDV